MTEQEFNNIDKRFDLMTTLLNANFIAVNERIDGINKRLDVSNGRLATHDKQITDSLLERQQLHADIASAKTALIIDCPAKPRLDALEKAGIIRVGVKQFIVACVTLVAIIIGSVYSTIKITESFQKKQPEITTQIPPTK